MNMSFVFLLRWNIIQIGVYNTVKQRWFWIEHFLKSSANLNKGRRSKQIF